MKRGLATTGRTLCAAWLVLACAPAAATSLQVTYIGNEGFLVAGGGHQVLIDGLYRQGVSGYVTIPAARRDRIEQAKAPYDEIELLLVTHHHADHFDADAVLRHLEHNPGARLISTPQVLERLQAGEAIAARVRSELPEEGERSSVELPGIKVQILNLHHGRKRVPPVQSLGFIVEMGGCKWLHIGDTEVSREELAAHGLSEEGIDVAFIPYWELIDPARRRMFLEEVQARRIVPIHVPAATAPRPHFGGSSSLPEMLERLRNVAGVVLVERQFETRTIP